MDYFLRELVVISEILVVVVSCRESLSGLRSDLLQFRLIIAGVSTFSFRERVRLFDTEEMSFLDSNMS